MYAALWRALPGPVALRVLLLIVLLGAVIVVCFEWLFPLVGSWLPYDETTVGADARAVAASTAPTTAPTHLLHTVRTFHG